MGADPGQRRTQVLRALGRTRKQLVESRVGLVNQLLALLEGAFPSAVGLFAPLDSDVAIAFLRRYPTQHAATTLTTARFAAYLRRISYCARKLVQDLFDRVHDAPAAGLNATEADGHAVCILARVRAIETTRREERQLQAEIIERLDAHADGHIFTSLPRAGHGVRAAALLAEIGDDPARFPDEESPRRPGRPRAPHQSQRQNDQRRLPLGLRQETPQRDHRLRRRLPTRQPLGRQDLQRRHRPRKTAPHAVRILARAWIRVIWRCWQHGADYNPQLHGGATRLTA